MESSPTPQPLRSGDGLALSHCVGKGAAPGDPALRYSVIEDREAETKAALAVLEDPASTPENRRLAGIRVVRPGVYQVSAGMRFGREDKLHGWGITRNSDRSGEPNVLNMGQAFVLARELHREQAMDEGTYTTLSWTGFLDRDDVLRALEEPRQHRNYQGVAADRIGFLRAHYLLDGFVSPAPRSVIRLDIEHFSAGQNIDFAKLPYGRVLHNAAPYHDQPNAVEYRFDIEADGRYRLDCKVAAAEPRPLRVLLNGNLVQENALAAATGGWEPQHQKWLENQATLLLPKGNHLLRLERASVFPHISEIELVRLS